VQARARPLSNTVFIVLSFEGPDKYSRVGGLATRVTGLVKELASLGNETHLFFVGQPDLPGYEVQDGGLLHLHRWCQWISKHHAGGSYDGEEAKLRDWNKSVPAYLMRDLLPAVISSGRKAVIIGEEWQTTDTLIALQASLSKPGWKENIQLVWNANNTYGFERINWAALTQAATITTVSRYMKYLMQGQGTQARVVPNGIDSRWLQPVAAELAQPLATALSGRTVITKVARWDAEKRWDYAVDSITLFKLLGLKPIFLARGGPPEKGGAVFQQMEDLGLTVSHARWEGQDGRSLTTALLPALKSDVVLLESLLYEEQSKILYRVSDAVLANSSIEPFGLVGLETMAAGGIAAVGSTGEDYVTNGYDAISLQTNDVWEFVRYVARLRNNPAALQAMRAEAQRSAARYTWGAVLERSLFPFIRELGFEPGPARRAEETGLPALLVNTAPVLAAATKKGAAARKHRPARRVSVSNGRDS